MTIDYPKQDAQGAAKHLPVLGSLSVPSVLSPALLETELEQGWDTGAVSCNHWATVQDRDP